MPPARVKAGRQNQARTGQAVFPIYFFRFADFLRKGFLAFDAAFRIVLRLRSLAFGAGFLRVGFTFRAAFLGDFLAGFLDLTTAGEGLTGMACGWAAVFAGGWGVVQPATAQTTSASSARWERPLSRREGVVPGDSTAICASSASAADVPPIASPSSRGRSAVTPSGTVARSGSSFGVPSPCARASASRSLLSSNQAEGSSIAPGALAIASPASVTTIARGAVCHVPCGRLVKGGRNDLAFDRPLHVCHLFGAFIDKENDEVNLGMVLGD